MNSNSSGMMMVSASEEECDVGLGLRMQQPKNDDDYSRKKTTPMVMMSMSMPHHHPHHHHPYHQQQYMLSPSSSGRVVGGDFYGGVGGSIYSGTSNHHLACVDEEAAAATLLATGSTSDSSSSAAAAAASVPVFSSSGKMAASANVRMPFTAAQWQEMERQRMIFKHMMTSGPVPPELLLPITESPPTVLPSQSNRGSDPEPWRCRRTDGKKWRCSRDVAPHQKYCERHSHKNRPRSRKPVELQADYTNTTNNIKKSNVTTTNSQSLNSCQNAQFLNQTPNPPSVFTTTVASAYEQPRGLEWFMKGETISNQEDYHHQVHHRQPMHATCNRIDPFHLKQPHMPLNSFSDYGSTHELHETRHFIDAWSTQHRDGTSSRGASVSASKKMPISSLSLTMCGSGEEDSENTDMGVELMGGEREKGGDLRPPHWMMSHGGSWMGSTTPGGPLAEALCLGAANASSGGMAVACEASPQGCIGGTPASSRSSSKDEGHELNLIN